MDPLARARRSGTARPPGRLAADPLGSFRTAGGAVLVTAPDIAADDPASWPVDATRRRAHRPRAGATSTLPGASCRASTSNAIVLVRDGRLIGLGSGQTSRVDAARQAVDKAREFQRRRRASWRGRAASDAFFPFPDGRACLAAGVSAFVQPGGSVRDADVIAAADGAGAAMLLTGPRHFRH